MDEGVSTSMDQLVEMLKERDNIKLNDVAKELNTTKEHVESWSKMLEKAGAVSIHYSVIGGAIIRKGPHFDELVKQGISQAQPQAGAAAPEAAVTSPAQAQPQAGAAAPEAAVTSPAQAQPQAGAAAPEAQASVAAAPAAQASAAAAPAVVAPAATKKAEVTHPPKPTKEYKLIRQRIDQGEHILEKDLVKLREEQTRITSYLDAIIKDSRKLTDYIEALHKTVQDTKTSREQRAEELFKSKEVQ